MSAQADTVILAELDFWPSIPCESDGHGAPTTPGGRRGHAPVGPATWIMRNTCPGCGGRTALFVCDARQQQGPRLYPTTKHTRGCQGVFPTDEWDFTFERIGGGS